MDVVNKLLVEFFPDKKIPGWQKSLFRWAIGKDKIDAYTDRVSDKQGIDWIENFTEILAFRFNVHCDDYDNIPAQGPTILFSNHPTVIDGIALISSVAKVRKDIKVVANHVIPLLLPQIEALTIGIRNMQGKIAVSQYKEMSKHLESGGVLIIFPAGKLAGINPVGLKEFPWHPGFLQLAKKTHATLVPVYIRGFNSLRYYLTAIVWRPLSNLMILRECLRHRGGKLHIKIGRQIDLARIDCEKKQLAVVAASFQQHVQQMATDKPPVLPLAAPLAQPENRSLLNAALSQCERLKQLADGKSVLLYRYHGEGYSPVLRELGRLREISFRAIGAGTGKKYDNDRYDDDYYHIILWDPARLEIAGAYRFVFAGEQIGRHGLEGLYSHSLFRYQPEALAVISQSIEIGRGFIQKQYQKTHALDELWKGIFHVALRHKAYKYLIGVLTIPRSYSPYVQRLMVGFYQAYLSSDKILCAPEKRYGVNKNEILHFFSGDNFQQDWCRLNHLLRDKGYELPWPYKQAVKWYSEGGSKIIAFVEDSTFNSIAGLNFCEINKLNKMYCRRYLPQKILPVEQI
ncbi:lysophospholipid acyltransferase family protein [Mixta calida]|uniref:lysophospholipid acyltransferase family protein n=3 Tax=Mixta calida TaxID=665913 RepID=UPI0034D44F52